MTGRLLWLVAIAGCYSPSALPGAPCNPTTSNCPEGQSCLPVAGGYECVTGPVAGDAPTGDTPLSDAPRDAAPGIDAPPDAPAPTWNLVQTGSVESNAMITLNASVSVGDVIIVAVQSPSMVVGITDDGANLYTEVPNTHATANGGGLGIDLWYAHSAISAKTISVAGQSVSAIVVWDVAGLRATNPLDVSASLSDQAATTTPSGAAVTTTQPGDFIVSTAMVLNQVSGIRAGNEFTEDSNAKANGWAHITSTSAAAGSHKARWDQPTSGVYCTATAAFFVGP